MKIKIKRFISKIMALFVLLLHYKAIIQMVLDKKRGLKVIVYQLGSPGQ